jgi:hypothetical protein
MSHWIRESVDWSVFSSDRCVCRALIVAALDIINSTFDYARSIARG